MEASPLETSPQGFPSQESSWQEVPSLHSSSSVTSLEPLSLNPSLEAPSQKLPLKPPSLGATQGTEVSDATLYLDIKDDTWITNMQETSLTQRLQSVEPIIDRICQIMGQVGISYGVLHRGQTVLAKGYGYRDEENKIPADENTLYNIASCTKAFTATACVLLADEGEINLDSPVQKYIPELREDRATLIDLLAHRTGYGRLDMSWVGQRSEVLVSHAELIKRVNALPRIRPLDTTIEWLYNNWMYAVAGVVIQRKSKEGDYLEYMKSHVLKQYGLDRTCIKQEDIPDANISLAYAASKRGQPIRTAEPPWEESPFTPGGGIRSCVSDMLKWGQQLLKAYAYEKEHRTMCHPGTIMAPQIILPRNISYGELERSYGMGFMRLMLPSRLSIGGRNNAVASDVPIPPIGKPNVHTLALSHCGENAGALSSFVLIPELDTAIVVLGNTTALGDANELITHVLASQIVDPDATAAVDYEALAESLAERCKHWHQRVLADPLKEHQVSGTSHGPLYEYAGAYRDPKLEIPMSVSLEKGQLILHQGGKVSQRSPLHHYHYETFQFVTECYDEHMSLGMIDYDDWRVMLVQFERDFLGAVIGLKWWLDADLPPAFLQKQA